MKWNQLESIQIIQDYWKRQYDDNLEKASKLPFYNPHPYKPSKKLLKRLKDGVSDITFITSDK